ncbi:HlyD family efflux transporter periplasmic adaptor subunit [bacterium]|nr:HlyD family efflux transporter periplasmic adaptor subunit [bacterium]
MMGGMTTAGSTTIISILPEGTWVKPGELVAELDSANFRLELDQQKIRVAGVKGDLEQVSNTLKVAEISLEEYRDGVFPQDKMLLGQYIAQCELRSDQARKNLAWSKDQVAKGLRASTALRADENEFEKYKIMLEEAQGMKERLEKFTAPRILKELQARIEAVRTDYFAIKNAYQLEVDRQRKIEEMIANCKLTAPREGIVVYANESNMWGRTEAQIQEGATVREGQAVFKVPNPNKMLVKAQINESKISYIRKGQRAMILVDAFPETPLAGTVEEITAIPAPPKGFSTDIRAYVATVSIDSGGFDALRPGMTAEVSFDVTTKNDTTRIPVDSIMFVKEKPFVAIPSGKSFEWRPIDIGLMSESYAELKSGIAESDKIVASPSRLSIPLPVVQSDDRPAANDNPAAVPVEPIAQPEAAPPAAGVEVGRE